jgi:hypothetical protein
MKYLQYPRHNPEPFRTLSMEEFNRLTTDERAAYLRRAVEHLGLPPKPGEPGSPP